MQAFVHKSLKKADTYVFLAAREDFACLPDALQAKLAPFQFVMELTLNPDRKLAQANAADVMNHLATRGYHLQMPPRASIDPLSEDWGTDA